MLRITGIVLACLFLAFPAQARQHRAAAPACVEVGTVMFPRCQDNNPFSGALSLRVTMHRERRADSTVVDHPAGCPRVAFCGCGAAVHVFGHSVQGLWLAANWFRFPRAAPAPGMVAVRRHHVFVLEADLGGGEWTVYDANSGGHATRVHARSIAGYTIVNPHA